ncbi:MAG: H-X9-DG-CTERM domain-containing protein [Armatimonadota bacterium]
MQDHDETFPTAATWVTELASNYGVTGKVWDCPTTSFKGTEAAPDYFFVGGSLLSDTAIGDIADPVAAPMVADLASPRDNKPYIVSDPTTEVLDLTVAASTVDKGRHNNGAVFAYVDGHVQWMTKDAITPVIFAGSLPKTITAPVIVGSIIPVQSYPNTGDVVNALKPFNMTRSQGSNGAAGQYRSGNETTISFSATDKSVGTLYMPDWLDKTNSLPASEVTVTSSWGGHRIKWPGGDLYGLNCDPVNPVNFTLVPATGASGAKRVGYIFNTDGNSAKAMTLTAVTIGPVGNQKVYTIPSTMTGAKAAVPGTGASVDNFHVAVMLVLPMNAGKPVKLTFAMTNTADQHAANALLFEP